MRKPITILCILILLIIISKRSFAQVNNDSKALTKEGIELFDAGKYSEAIEKYTAALKIDPNNTQADYELGYTLYTTGKGNEAIPYLEKILKSGDDTSEAYDLLGSIYDDNKEPEKAIDAYKKGIKANDKFEHLYFNLGITYLRIKKYDEAIGSETNAIKLDQKHASSQRIYAMAQYEQNHLIKSLLAWCSFLFLEPQSSRSAEAMKYVDAILNHGISRTGNKTVTISISQDQLGSSDELMLPIAVTSAVLPEKTGNKTLTAVDSLSLQLQSVFEIAYENKAVNNDVFFKNYFAKFFYDLAKSGYMPAFARYISLSKYKTENVAWINENKKQLDDLDLWVRNYNRNF